MKKHLYLLAFVAVAWAGHAQEITKEAPPGQELTLVERLTHGKKLIDNAEMNFQLFTSANANFTGSNFDGMNFKLNRVKLEIKGSVNDWLSYHYRQSFNKYADPFSLDNLSSSLELAYAGLKVSDRFAFTVGKHTFAFGGYEYYVNPIKVREFSEFNNQLSCYQAGISGTWNINSDQELCFQIMNNRNGSDEETYVGGLPQNVKESKIPFIYIANWNSFYFDKVLQLRYSGAIGQQAKGYNAYYFTCGNIIEKGPVISYLDIMYTRQGLDQHGIISHLGDQPIGARYTQYLTFIADIDYRFHTHWNGYIKGSYETGGVYRANGNYKKGLYRRSWNAQASLEYFPMKNSELLIFLLFTYRGIHLQQPAIDLGFRDPDKCRISLGFVYSIPVF